MSQSRGLIVCRERYAQGKMLDHSQWRLGRGVTPSDIDFVVESYGCFLFAELTRGPCEWGALKVGQRMLYDSLAKIPGNHVVCLAKHAVPIWRDIDTYSDIEQANVRWACGTKSLLIDSEMWQWLVTEWVLRPDHVVRLLDKHYSEMTEQF